MKKIVSIACLVVMMLSLSQLAGALTYTFEPDDGGRKGANSSGTSNMSNDLWDLDHGYKYTWGIGWQLPEEQEIVSASLVFTGIRNWTEETNDLWVHLLDLGADNVGAATKGSRARPDRRLSGSGNLVKPVAQHVGYFSGYYVRIGYR